MPTTLIDSAIFEDIFSTDPMRRVWSDENRTQKYLDIEAALARVQARLGIIPQEAADEINRHCRVEQIDLTKLKRDTECIGYPVLGVVRQLNALCRDRLGNLLLLHSCSDLGGSPARRGANGRDGRRP
jgi:3-carboxy-cis,cis-muconate cycloisomerase